MTEKVSAEFVHTVKKYIEYDDKIKEIKKSLKELSTQKKQNEEFILEYLQSIEENTIDISNGKLIRSVTKTQSPLKKELIQKTLTDIIGDSSKALDITDKIVKSRPIVEKIVLKRTTHKVND